MKARADGAADREHRRSEVGEEVACRDEGCAEYAIDSECRCSIDARSSGLQTEHRDDIANVGFLSRRSAEPAEASIQVILYLRPYAFILALSFGVTGLLFSWILVLLYYSNYGTSSYHYVFVQG